MPAAGFVIIEARKSDGELYPARTICQVLQGILRYTHDKDPYTLNFIDPKNPKFKGLHRAMDMNFRNLRTIGADTITMEEENLLWERGVLGTGTPLALICSIFYYISWEEILLVRGEEHS